MTLTRNHQILGETGSKGWAVAALRDWRGLSIVGLILALTIFGHGAIG